MRTLYWKIFIWFWLTMILMVSAMAWSTLQFVHVTRERQPDGLEGLGRAGAVVARIAARMPSLSRDEIAEVLDVAQRHAGIDAYVIDAVGDDVRGGRLPDDLYAWLLDPMGVEFGSGPTLSRGTIVVRPFRATDGEPLKLLANLSAVSPPKTAALARPPAWLAGIIEGQSPRVTTQLRWLRVGVAVLVSGAVCYLLALYLTAPVRALRDATRSLAAGNLAVRVSAEMGMRRDEIADLGRDFDVMAERIQGLLEAHGRLIRDVSHELRSPLARLQVALGLARRDGNEGERSALDRIELEAARLNHLIADILALARLDQDTHDGVAAASGPVDLGRLVEGVIADAEFEAQDAGPAFRVAPHDAVMVRGDRDRLRAAVENVVRNAMRFAPAGSAIEVALSCETPGQVRLAVRDHGPGVDEAALAHLFEPFYRADEARARTSGGHGIGLAITARCVTLHGGEVNARNHPDGGLEVAMTLPAT